jgi:preprotein translocase subunit SecE
MQVAEEEDVTKDASMDSSDLPEESKPAPKSVTKTGRGGWGSPIQFLRDVRLEMKKVTWPTRSEVTSTTVVVLIAVVFFAAYLWGVDNLLELFFHQIEIWLRG